MRKAAGRVILGVPALTALIASSDNIHNQIIPEPIKDPTPAVSELPTGMPSANIDLNNIQLPPTPEPKPTPTPTIPSNPTQEVSATSQPSQQEQSEKKELIPYSPSTTIIDFAPDKPIKGLNQKRFVSNEQMLARVLGSNYVPPTQLIQEFGEDYKAHWEDVVTKYPSMLFSTFADIYFSHGENVAKVMQNEFAKDGFKVSQIDILPLQEIFDSSTVTPITDELGNVGLSIEFDPEKIIDMLKTNNNPIVSGSFQVGTVDVYAVTKEKIVEVPEPIEHGYEREAGSDVNINTDKIYLNPDNNKAAGYGIGYIVIEGNRMIPIDKDGNHIQPITREEFQEMTRKRQEDAEANAKIVEDKKPSLRIVGAYTKGKAMKNLPKLFQVCDAYPNKFFVMAAGNQGEDLREARVKLAEQWSGNLLMPAEWERLESPAGNVHGAEPYTNNRYLGIPSGSSFSTPIIAAKIDLLLKEGFSFKQAKEKMLTSSDTITYESDDGRENTIKVFDPSKLRGK